MGKATKKSRNCHGDNFKLNEVHRPSQLPWQPLLRTLYSMYLYACYQAWVYYYSSLTAELMLPLITHQH